MNQRATLLEGSLDDIELANVLQTVSVSRRSIALELREPDGAVFGTLVLKAGQIVSVASEGLSGIAALRKLVAARRPGRFLVYRASGVDLREHLGPVADVLSNVMAGPDARGAVLAQGSLDKIELQTVLEALSLSRQSMLVELFAADDRQLGTLALKSGQLLAASCGGATGVLAARALLEAGTEGRFVVTRSANAAQGEPLLSLRALLQPSAREESLLEVGEEDISEADAEEVQPTQVAPRPTQAQPSVRSRPPPLPKSQPPSRSAPPLPLRASRPPAREASEPEAAEPPPLRPSVAPGTRPSVPFGRELGKLSVPAGASVATRPPIATPDAVTGTRPPVAAAAAAATGTRPALAGPAAAAADARPPTAPPAAVPGATRAPVGAAEASAFAEIPGARTEPRASAPWLDVPPAAPGQLPMSARAARTEPPRAPSGASREPSRAPSGAWSEPPQAPPSGAWGAPQGARSEPPQAVAGARGEPSQAAPGARSEPPRDALERTSAQAADARAPRRPQSEAPRAQPVNGVETPVHGALLASSAGAPAARVNGDGPEPQSPSRTASRPPKEAPPPSLPRGDLAPPDAPREVPRVPRSEPPAAPQREVPRAPRSEPSVGDADSTSRHGASDGTITARHQAVRGGTPIIAITSPKGGAGRSTLALNLAVSLARRGRRVVMVDADASNLLPALNLADRPFKGVADALEGWAPLADTVLDTRVPGLKLIPSGDLSEETYRHPGWQQLLTTLAQQADLVLVDCAPGWYGATLSVLEAATHQLLVLAADPAARRLCAAYQARLQKLLKAKAKPELLGLVINMLDYQTHASVRSLEELSTSEYARHLFDIPIPRSPAFMEASARGVPIVHVEQGASPTVAWVFETLATALLERLQLERPALASAPLLA